VPTFYYGGKAGRGYELEPSDEFVVVRTEEREGLDRRSLSRRAFSAARELEPIFSLPGAGIEVHRVRARRSPRAVRDRARAMLSAEPEVEFAGRVLVDPAGIPVLYTENLFIKFHGDRAESACRRDLETAGLTVKRPIDYVRNGYFAAAPQGSGMAVFEICERLINDDAVELCHPELVREGRRRGIFPRQWHLKAMELDGQLIDGDVDVEGAWAVTQGDGVVIAVIDDGIDVDHEEFSSPEKIVAPRDATSKTSDPRPHGDEDHGTACAGVACAEGLHGACGVAPRAKLLPVRLRSGLGSQDEADAIKWAAENGADVISCSWGPEDGAWQDPDDPRHDSVHPLPDSTRLAIDWATENGRSGKGTVFTWAAGNGNESVDNDGYASYGRVIAVAACNPEGKRCAYSDFGEAIWCAFPSRDFEGPTSKFGIWTTDRSGRVGYNKGNIRRGDRAGNYTKNFSGTSSACPGVAGVAALMLSANPELSWQEVKEHLRQSCDKVDPEGGDYDPEGHSKSHGYGRVNAARAVAAVKPPAPRALTKALTSPPSAAEKIEAEVKIRTEAPEYWLRIDEHPLHVRDGRAPIRLELGQTYILSWWVEGPSGTPYEISLDAGGVEVAGSLPVERNIALDETKSAGTRKFRLSKP